MTDRTVAGAAIVAGVQLRWDGVWQRPHHILSRLAKKADVIVVEEPFVLNGHPEEDEVRYDGAVTIVRPIRRANSGMADERVVHTVRSLLATRRPLVWLYQPLMLALTDELGSAVVYDCMDDLAAFAFAPPKMREMETMLLERAALVFCGGRTLYEGRRNFGQKVKLLPSGVEFERFNGARTSTPHALASVLPRPRWGYVGVIDERIDYELLALLADADVANLVMVGPVMKIDPACLPRKPNVHFTGKVPYGTLPSILAGLDVGLMPFARNASTRSISPTKTLEYLAAGLPVVSTPIADVVHDYGDVVTVAEGRDFLTACLNPTCSPRATEIARAHEWDAIAGEMWSEVEPLLR